MKKLHRRSVKVFKETLGWAIIAVGLIMTGSEVRVQAADATFTALDDLPGAIVGSVAYAVSADGSVIVGYSPTSLSDLAFRWTAENGMISLGVLPGGIFGSIALNVSADGSTVVGISYSAYSGSLFEAFRWTANDGIVGLGDLPGDIFFSWANGASADGSVIVGWGSTASGPEAYRWMAGGVGMVGLGYLPGVAYASYANAVSPDGTVIVGSSYYHAFRWTAEGGMIALGEIAGVTYESDAIAVSADGSVVVGEVFFLSGYNEAFRWTADSGMVSLGYLPAGSPHSHATGVSADGTMIVGESGSYPNSEAFLWTVGGGMRSLKHVLVNEYGVDLNGWTLSYAAAISGDGSTVVGGGINPAGNYAQWIARIPISLHDRIRNLIALVHNFNLHPGITKSLDKKLRKALHAVNADDPSRACGPLHAFIHEVQHQAGKKIPAEQADQLIAVANQISAALSCSE